MLKELIGTLPKSWKQRCLNIVDSNNLQDLNSFLQTEYQEQTIYPPKKEIFSAFRDTPFEEVKVVILGQDPYHGEGQAHGLAFSVQPGVKIPPSLKNIYKEIHNEFQCPLPEHGNLESWAKQGVFLLNNVLTVRAKQAGSHQKKGWEKFTSEVIQSLAEEKEGLVFLLWGSPAQKKCQVVDENKHLVLKSVHPSPLSAYRGFFDNNHFKQANEYLISKGKQPIEWCLPL